MVTDLGPWRKGGARNNTPSRSPHGTRPKLTGFRRSSAKHVVGQSHGLCGRRRMLERVDPLDLASANGDVCAMWRRVAGKTALQVEERNLSALRKMREVRSVDAGEEQGTLSAESC
jgi:hypothetical protein